MKRILFAALFGLLSCHSESESPLDGTYTEIEPIAGRSQLNFVYGIKVIKTEKGSSLQDVFLYRIQNDTIILIPTWDATGPTKHTIQIIDNSTFVIENLYASIPEEPKTYMRFKKK